MERLGKNTYMGEDRRNIRQIIYCIINKESNSNSGFWWVISAQYGQEYSSSGMDHSLYWHIYVFMGIHSHNISSGQYIQITTNMIICGIITYVVTLLDLSIIEGRSGNRLWWRMSLIQISGTEPLDFLKHKTCISAHINFSG